VTNSYSHSLNESRKYHLIEKVSEFVAVKVYSILFIKGCRRFVAQARTSLILAHYGCFLVAGRTCGHAIASSSVHLTRVPRTRYSMSLVWCLSFLSLSCKCFSFQETREAARVVPTTCDAVAASAPSRRRRCCRRRVMWWQRVRPPGRRQRCGGGDAFPAGV
jgi:hypothetical protein